MAALVPFWTQLLNENPDNSTATISFGLYMILTNFSLLGIWMYATGNQCLVDRDLDKRTIKVFTKIILIGSALVAIVIALALFEAMLGWLLFIPAAYFISVTAWGRHRPRSKKSGQ